MDFARGNFRVRGDTIDVFPAEHSELACASSCSTTRSRACSCSTRSPAGCARAFHGLPCTRAATMSRRATRCCWRSKPSRPSCLSASSSCCRTASWSKPSAWSSARFDLEMLSEVGHCKASKTIRATWQARRRRPAQHADRLPARDALMFLDESTSDDRPAQRHVQRRPLAQDHAGGMAFGCPARWTTGRSSSRNSRHACARWCSSRHTGRLRKNSMRARWSNRWCAHGSGGPGGGRCGLPFTRWTMCCRKSASGRTGASRCCHHADQAHGRSSSPTTSPTTV